MLLNKDIAQKLVDGIMDNLGYNINIMNDDGIIIASGSPERLGSYHQVAAKVIKDRQRIDITERNSKNFKGVREGINMPFYFHNRIAGVIGITGNPKEIENTAMLVKMTAELMMEQEYLKERTQTHQSNKTFFVNKLLTCHETDDFLELYQWGLKLGYDLNISRVAFVFTVKKIALNHIPSKSIDIIKNDIINIIKTSPNHTKQDISSPIDISKILVLKTVSKENIPKQVYSYIEPIQKSIKEKYGLAAIVGIGSLRYSVEELKESYNEARFLIDLGEKNSKLYGNYYIDDYLVEYFLSKIPKTNLEYYLEKYNELLKDKPEISETIHALVNNNMSITDTSKALFLHRNTVLFRLNKIKELFDMDPLHNDKDRMLLRIIDLYNTISY